MATLLSLDATPPAWAVQTFDLSGAVPVEIAHDGPRIDLTAPDGRVVAQANLSLIREVGRDDETEMVIAEGDFSSFPAASIPEFTKAVRVWADALDAEAAKLGVAQ